MTMQQDFTLDYGSHESRDEGVCLMELVARVAGEPHSDLPDTASPTLAAYARLVNDRLDDDARQRLLPLVHDLTHTNCTSCEGTRGHTLARIALAEYGPGLLHDAGLDHLAPLAGGDRHDCQTLADQLEGAPDLRALRYVVLDTLLPENQCPEMKAHDAAHLICLAHPDRTTPELPAAIIRMLRQAIGLCTHGRGAKIPYDRDSRND